MSWDTTAPDTCGTAIPGSARLATSLTVTVTLSETVLEPVQLKVKTALWLGATVSPDELNALPVLFQLAKEGTALPVQLVTLLVDQLKTTLAPESIEVGLAERSTCGGLTVTVTLAETLEGFEQDKVKVVVCVRVTLSPPLLLTSLLAAFQPLSAGLALPEQVVTFCEDQVRVVLPPASTVAALAPICKLARLAANVMVKLLVCPGAILRVCVEVVTSPPSELTIFSTV